MVRRLAAVFLTLLWLSGCRSKQLPYGLSSDYVDAVVAIADQAVAHCDRLVEMPRCYHGVTDDAPDPAGAVPLGSNPLGGNPELVLLNASCSGDGPGGYQDCSSIDVVRRPHARSCLETKEFGNWPPLKLHTNGVSVLVAKNAECLEPWVLIAVTRMSPKGRTLNLNASFLSKEWLDSHPTPPKDERKTETNRSDSGGHPIETGRQPKSAGTVQIAQPAVDGALEVGAIVKGVSSGLPDLEACYKGSRPFALGRPGKVVLHWWILPNGGTKEREVEQDTFDDQDLEDCILKVARSWRFAPTKGRTEVSFPLVFE